MRKLWVWLALAFGLVTVVGVVTVGILADRQVSSNFQRYIAQSRLADSDLVPQLTAYYAAHGGWDGVDTVFAANGAAGRGLGRGALVLTDVAGQVVYGGAQGRGAGPARDLGDALPLMQGGAIVGYLYEVTPGGPGLSAAATQFLATLNQTLLQAGLLAGVLGLLLGVLIAQALARPLGRLATAARAVAAGDLTQRAPVRGPSEVADVARAFNHMAGSLEDAEEARHNMVADIAHELRTPLSVLQGNLQAILDDVYPLTKPEIAALYDETIVLRRLVSDLYELAQAEAGQLPLAIRAVAAGEIVAQVCTAFAEAAATQGVRLETAVADGLPTVAADADRLGQVLHNLLANALRHTPGGGRIRVTAEAAEPGQVRIAVADTGSGIAPEDLPHVFDRFWRADRARGRDGAGLGLAIARQLVERQGGRIGAESTPGQGSRFWLTLPVAAPIPAA